MKGDRPKEPTNGQRKKKEEIVFKLAFFVPSTRRAQATRLSVITTRLSLEPLIGVQWPRCIRPTVA